MKFLSAFSLFLMATMLLSSCDKIKDLISVDAPIKLEFEFELDKDNPTAATFEDGYNIEEELNEFLKDQNNKLDIDNIKSVKLQSCVVTITPNASMPNDNLTALSSFKMEASPTKNLADFVILADMPNAPTNGYEVSVPVNSKLEMKSYLKGRDFQYRMSYRTSRKLESDVTGKAVLTFIVKAGLD